MGGCFDNNKGIEDGRGKRTVIYGWFVQFSYKTPRFIKTFSPILYTASSDLAYTSTGGYRSPRSPGTVQSVW